MARRGPGRVRLPGAAARGVARAAGEVFEDAPRVADDVADAVPGPRRRRGGRDEAADPDYLRTNRPSLRTTTRRSVYRDAPRAPNGEDFVCPNTGEIIPCKRDADGNALRFNDRGQPDPHGYTHPVDNPPSRSGEPQVYNFGHVPEAEYRRLVQVTEDYPGTLSNRDFDNEYNSPGHYQIEHPTANQGHGYESTEPGYGEYTHLVPGQPTEGSP